MSSHHSTRDRIITEWFFQDWIGDKNHLPQSEDVLTFMKILLDTMSICGDVNQYDREYILGRSAIFGNEIFLIHSIEFIVYIHYLGATQEVLDKLQTYQPSLSNRIEVVYEYFHLPHVQKTRMAIIYNIFRILGVDHKINPKQLEGIYTVAKKLDMTDEQIQQIQNMYEEEKTLREKRASLLYSHGFDEVINEYHKLH